MSRIVRVLAFIVFVWCIAAAAAASVVSTAPNLEIALREGPDGLTVFVVDSRRDVVLSGHVEPGMKLSVGDLRPVSPAGMLRRPVALAVRGSRLVVVDAAVPAVFECDLVTQQWRTLWRGEPLPAPVSVAIASDGSVVIADVELRGLVVISPKGEPTVVRAGEQPRRVRVDDRGVLYVLDGELGVVRVESLDPARSFTSQPELIRGMVTVPVSPEASDFSVVRDVFYAVDQGTVRVSATGSRVTLPFPPFSWGGVSDVAASDSFIAALDAGRMVIAVADRALPVESVLSHIESNPNAAWLDLLAYLVQRALVPARPIRVQEGETAYEQVLARVGVLVRWDNAAKLAPPADKVRALFCALNAPACTPERQLLPRAPAAEVIVPQIALRATIDTESVVLGGRSVQQLVEERVVTPEQRASVTDAYLASINPDTGNTLEAEMARLGFVAATPMARQLAAGTLVQIDDGSEVIVGSLHDLCGFDPPVRSRTALPEQLDAPAAALPGDARPRTGDRVQIAVSGWQREALLSSTLTRCRPKGNTEGVYVIAEAISALDVRIAPSRTLRKGQPAAPPPITGPIYLGYKPVPLSGLALGVTLPVDLKALKPQKGPNTISKRTEGSVTLPVTRWRADLLVPVRDYYAPGGPLADLRRQYTGLELSARERLRVSKMSAPILVPAGQWPPDPKKFIEDSRQALRKAISYVQDLAEQSGSDSVYIGIVEDPHSVNINHPDFAEAEQSVWQDYSADSGLHRHKPQPPPAVAAAGATDTAAKPALKRVQQNIDHGTHVAGIIAARSGTLVPGLLKSTNLVLVPSDKTADLLGAIEDARSEGVFIFNMSMSLPPSEDKAIGNLHRRFVKSWGDSLFVVAAGNETDDLNLSGRGEPARWASELPNVIAVAAARTDGTDVLGEHTDQDSSETSPGSNYGSKVVDLLAPGEMLCSLGYRGYAYACGSSQAAPQVTATAAMLWSVVRQPAPLRARLLYTADWRPQYAGKAWGGLLNVRRALSYPLHNVLTTFSEPADPHEIVPDGNARLRIDGTEYKRDGTQPAFRKLVPFSHILRLSRDEHGVYRVFLLKDGTDLAIVDGTVRGELKCTSLTHFDPATQRFGARPHPAANCKIEVGQIKDYVAATPGEVRFF